jgi:hypothetical protein
MKLRLVLILALALMCIGIGRVEAQQATNCEATFDMFMAPGIWREGNSGTFTTNGEAGVVTCDGPVNGKAPTGPGTFGAHGRYGTHDPDTCGNVEGIYENFMTVPTADGHVKVGNKGDWVAGAFKGAGAFGGRFTGETGDGTFEASPKEGDCLTTPQTAITVVARWTMKEG